MVVGLAAGLLASPIHARESTGAAATLAPKTATVSRMAAPRVRSKTKAPLIHSSSSRKNNAAPASSAPSPLGPQPQSSAPPLLRPVSPRDAAIATVTATSDESSANATTTALAPTPRPAKLKGNGNKLLLFTDGLLEDMGDLPVLGAFLLPVTEGVTIPTFEGLTSLTFAVKPTKITRGSGVVAIGTFD